MKRCLFVVASLLIAACNDSHNKNADSEAASPSTVESAGQDQLNFANINEKVFKPSCVACHGASGGVNLESYVNVKANLAAVQQATLVTRTMPQGARLSEEQMTLLSQWIEAGAPETSSSESSPTTPTPDPGSSGPQATFASISSEILEKKCTMCHAPGKSESQIPLVTLANVRSQLKAGDATNSRLVIAVKSNMPPRGYTSLTNQEIDSLSQWINNGAKD